MIHIFWLGLVSRIHNICDWYIIYTLFMPGIHDIQNLCPDHVSDFIYIRTHPIKFNPIQLLNKRQHWPTGHGHVQKSVTTTLLCPNP